MLLKSITVCCLMLNVQTQNPFFQYNSQFLNPDIIYNPDDFSVQPLSFTTPNELERRKLYLNESLNKKNPTTSVEIQKSVVTEFGTTVDDEPNDVKRNNIVNRQISTSTSPSRQITQNFGQFGSQISPNNQIAYYGQRKPEISLGRPTVAVPQSELNRPTIQQISLGKPSSSQQDRPRAPQTSQGSQSTPEISLSRPSVVIPANLLNKPTGPQIQSNPQPSTSAFNFPTEQASGFNTLLYSVTNFGVNLLKTLDALHSGNVVVSPFSIASLLGLLQQGASGQTLAQITSALQMSADATAPAYAKVSEEVRARNSRNILRVANNMFLSVDFPVDKDFKNTAINSFNSDVTPLSFQRGGDAARQINSWVASRTDNQIQNLIAPDSLDYATQMVLVNAIYFKGLWEVPFRVESTLPKEFLLSSGQPKTVQFMRMRKLFRTGIDKATSAKVIVLPFERDEYHLMVVLPNELMGMRHTLASLTDARLLSYLSFQALDTALDMPKFSIRADTDLTVVLKSLGVTNMFRRDYSELNGIGAYGAQSPTISSAVHSASLSIDEKGGTAAAATAFAAVALSYDEPDVVFKVNRPFIAVLWDNKSSLPLFMAKIEDPQQ